MLSIKEILKKNPILNKPFIYNVINKTNWLISEKIVSNTRFFNEKDLEIFLFFKKEWMEAWFIEYWIKQDCIIQSDIEKDTNKKDSINISIEEEIKLNNNIQKLEEIVKIKDEMVSKYALSFKEERRDKEIMLKEKEKERQERLKIQEDYNKLSNRYNLFKIIFIIVIFLLFISILINSEILIINLK